MLPVETRLKRMENRLRNQRIFNLILMGVAAIALVQPAVFDKYIGLAQRPILLPEPKPIVRAQLPAAKNGQFDIDHIRTRRLSITDAQGRERMTLLVDTNDSPFVIVKDEEGRFRATMAVQMDGRGAFGLWNTEKQPVYGVLEEKPAPALEISQVKTE